MILPAPDERVDTLPSGWLWKLFGELVTHSQNGVSKRRSVTGNPTPVLRLADVREGEIDESSPREIRLSDEEIKKYVLQVGDLLCVRVNGSRSITGRLVYFRSRKVWAYCDHFIRFRLNPDIGYSKYLAHYFNTEAVRRYLGEHMVSTAGQNTVSQGTVLGVVVPVAPVNQQRAVVAEIEKQFSRLDEAVANLKRVKANLKRYKAAVLKAAVEGRLTEDWRKQHPNVEPASKLLERILAERRAKWKGNGTYKEPDSLDTSNLPELPDSWCWANLEQIKLFSLYGPRFSSEDYATNGPLVLRTSDISESGKVRQDTAPRLSLTADEVSKYRLERGDLLITRTGSLGTLAVFNDAVEAIPGAYLIQYRMGAPFETVQYIFHFFKSPVGQKQLIGGGAGVGRPNLNAPTIEAISIPLPSLAEQMRIVAEVERRLSIIEELEAAVESNLTRADRLRQSILSQAFSGQLVTAKDSCVS